MRVESTSSPSSKLAAACAPVANTLMRKSAIPFLPIQIFSLLPVLIYMATDDLVWATGKIFGRYKKMYICGKYMFLFLVLNLLANQKIPIETAFRYVALHFQEYSNEQFW